VKTRLVQMVFVLVCTVLAAALQEMLPCFGGTKPSILLALVLFWSFTERRPDPRDARARKTPFYTARWIPAVLLAGAFEDALSGFPTGCAAGFFALAGVAARLLRTAVRTLRPATLGLIAAVVAAPLHELWLGMWGVVGADPSPLVRFFACTLTAAPAGALVFLLLPPAIRHAGVEDVVPEGRLA